MAISTSIYGVKDSVYYSFRWKYIKTWLADEWDAATSLALAHNIHLSSQNQYVIFWQKENALSAGSLYLHTDIHDYISFPMLLNTRKK